MCRTVAGTMVFVLVVLGVARPLAQATQPDRRAGPSGGQPGVTAGVKAGVNISDLRHDEESDSRIGLVAGGFVARRVNGALGLQVEGLYSAKGDKFFNTTIAIDYLEIPVLATFRLPDSVRMRPVFLTGPAVELKLRTRYGDAPDSVQDGFNQFVHRWELGWLVGGGIDLPLSSGSMTLEGRFTLGLTPVFDADPSDSDAVKRNRVLSVVLGYRFK
jgi:hypothetical protein